MKNTKQVFSLFLALILATSGVSAIPKDHEVKRSNKRFIKTIKSSDGDIIDCIKLTDQPAFNHPLLKNHTIQLSPTIFPKWGQSKQIDSKGSRKGMSQSWQLSGSCPHGTIPIRRTTESTIGSFANKNLTTNDASWAQNGNEAAIGYMNGGEYYGTEARLSVWNPKVDGDNEYSKTQVWVIGSDNPDDPNDIVDSIEAGWHVSPGIYPGDHQTRFFVFWAIDGYKIGCYNLLCPGFVQTSKDIIVGGVLTPLSSYGDKSAMQEITVAIWRDPTTFNWWLSLDDNNVGYWPSSLFRYLNKHASIIRWGGVVLNPNNDYKHTTTEMGSGHFAEEGFSKASYFTNIFWANRNIAMQHPSVVSTTVSRSECYNIQTFHAGTGDGTYLFYGGPGKNDKCP